MGLAKDGKVKMTSKFTSGQLNLITDVPGVKVGQVTLEDDEKGIHTGVTAVLPHGGNLFKDKVMAAVSVINGFGKSAGLVQIEELGTIESPIMMTNTLSVGTVLDTTVKYMLEQNEEIGVTTGTVNCVVTECNDGELNDIRGQHVKAEHVTEALNQASELFEEGAVGAGTGMICMGLKGGIGSASRVIELDGQPYTIGALTLTNFGFTGNLRIDGRHIDTCEPKNNTSVGDVEKGSVIILIGTDIPLNERQLKRMAKRATIALARTGSFCGNGSGDISIAFSTANRVPHQSANAILQTKMLHDDRMDVVFEATAEAVEEAILSSLAHAKTVCGVRGKVVHALNEYI